MSVTVSTIRILPESALIGLTQNCKVDILTELLDTGNVFDAIKVDIFVNDIIPTPDSLAGAFTQPTWTGYAAKNLTSNPATPAGTYGATTEFVSADWQSGSDADETVYGFYWTDQATGLQVKGYHRLATPIPVQGIESISNVLALLIQ